MPHTGRANPHTIFPAASIFPAGFPVIADSERLQNITRERELAVWHQKSQKRSELGNEGRNRPLDANIAPSHSDMAGLIP